MGGRMGFKASVVTRAQITEMQRLRQAGLTLEAIGRRVGVSPVTVWRYTVKPEQWVAYRVRQSDKAREKARQGKWRESAGLLSTLAWG
jgi:IS30 family transposase